MQFQKNVKNWSYLPSSKNGLNFLSFMKNLFLGSKFCPFLYYVSVR